MASNQDVRQQETFKTALMGAAVLFGGAALGAGAINKLAKNTNLGGGLSSTKIAKKLYGDHSNLDNKIISSFASRSNADIAENQMKRYAVGKSMLGKDRVYRKDASLIDSFKDNYLNKDVKRFNQTIGDYKKGNFGNDVFGKSKGSLYNDLYQQTEKAGVGLNSKELTKLTDNIYNSNDVAKLRPANWSLEDDINFTNKIWNDEARSGRGYSRGKPMAHRTSGDMSSVPYYSKKRAEESATRARAEAGEKAMRERDNKRIERAQLRQQPGDPLADPNRKNRILRMQEEKRLANKNEYLKEIPSVAGQFEKPTAKTKRGRGSGAGRRKKNEPASKSNVKEYEND